MSCFPPHPVPHSRSVSAASSPQGLWLILGSVVHISFMGLSGRQTAWGRREKQKSRAGGGVSRRGENRGGGVDGKEGLESQQGAPFPGKVLQEGRWSKRDPEACPGMLESFHEGLA